MLNICLYGACDNLGGTEIYLITLVRALKDKIKFSYLVHHSYGTIPFEEEITKAGGTIYREYYFYSEKNLSSYISPKEIIARHPEWDGIYLNVQRIHTAYRLLIEAKRANISYRVIHAHNNNYNCKPKLRDKVYEGFFKLTKNVVVTNYLACSKLAGEWMFGEKDQVTVIPNAVDFKKFGMDENIRDEMRNRYNILKEDIVIGFCGRLSYQKYPELLINIIDEMKLKLRCKLLIVGDGDLREKVYTLASSLDVLDSTIFIGNVNNTTKYYQMMDCFVLPSRFEGFGIVLLEAQAAGLRCYTTDKVVPYETNVTGRVTFVSEDASAKQWAETIIANGFDRKDCTDVLEKSNYSIESMKKKILTVLRDTVDATR